MPSSGITEITSHRIPYSKGPTYDTTERTARSSNIGYEFEHLNVTIFQLT